MTRALRLALVAIVAWSACLQASAATTAIHFNSSVGDYIGQGEINIWTPADGNFTAEKNDDNGVSIHFDGGLTNWDLEFAAPHEAPLTVGEYLNATRWPFQSATDPGLNVSGSGRGCNTSFGTFTITEITYGDGEDILAFAAEFEQRCEQEDAPALRGKVLFNAESSNLTLTDTEAPTLPTELVATATSQSQIDLTWTVSTDDFAVSAYAVYRDGTLVATLGDVARYSDIDLDASTTYEYTVSACDAAGNCSAQSTAVSAKTKLIPDFQAPSVPTGLTATADSSSKITLAWTASTDNIGVTAYKVYRSGTLVATAGNVTSTSITGLTPATGAIYVISACDLYGNCSGQSASVSVTTQPDTQAPTIPAGLIAIPMSAGQVNLVWAAATDDIAVSAYKAYRDGVLLATFPALTHYSDFGRTASTRYSYTVVACDVSNNCSAQSAAALAATLPSGVTATNSKANCLFNWAEANYASEFAPAASRSVDSGAYYLRHYTKTNSYLGVTSSNVYYLGPSSDNALLDLGAVSTWYATAGCN